MKSRRLFPLAVGLFFSVVLAAVGQQLHWPMTFSSPAGAVTIYEPQVDTFNQNTLTAHAAVSVVPNGQSQPVFGAMWFNAQVQTDRVARTVQLESVQVTNSRFPQADASVTAALPQIVSQETLGGRLSLDNILASLALTQKQQAASTNLNNTPPQIVYSDVPAVLVSLDGPAQLQPAAGTGLMRVVNTPFFLVFDPAGKTYYLRGPGQWLSAPDVMGPWQSAASVPDAVTQLAATVKTSDPSGSEQAMETGSVPKIIVATQPTELIQTDGPAEFGTIAGTNLLYVSNTDSDVFMNINTQALYVLLSGRWFTAASKAGPWTFVAPDALPPDFAQIPPGSPKADVLVSVAGTSLSQSAVLDAAVPQTAAIRRDADGPKVTYDGDPKFQAIPETSVSYAVNTAASVLQVGDTFYCCSEGVWFVANSPQGPWKVATSVPDAVYTIPPTSPVYNVTYCYVYNSTPDVVYCGYLPGYVGSYVWGGVVVYGTGWPYAPWVGAVYIPRPVTWGFAAVYNPVACGWGFSVGVGVGWGATFGAAWTNHGWWGAGGWHSWNGNTWRSNNTVNINRNVNVNNTNIYNRNTTRIANNTINRNVNAVGNTINRDNSRNVVGNDVNRVDNSINRVGDNRVDNSVNRNDVFAGKDGNVYRHSLDGWQSHGNDGWKSVRDSGGYDNFQRDVQPQLNRDFSARSGGGFSGGHVGGGGFRGGGGGRR